MISRILRFSLLTPLSYLSDSGELPMVKALHTYQTITQMCKIFKRKRFSTNLLGQMELLIGAIKKVLRKSLGTMGRQRIFQSLSSRAKGTLDQVKKKLLIQDFYPRMFEKLQFYDG
jgi:hypothetical protein